MKNKPSSSRVRCGMLLAGLAFLGPSLPGAVIGYWRFEADAFTADSSGNNLTLTNNNATVEYGLQSSGAGANFPRSIPFTGAANGQAAQFANPSTTTFTVADRSLFTVGSFSIEAFINASAFQAGSGSRVIAGQWDTAANNRGWFLGVSGSSGASQGVNRLFLQISSDGTDAGSVVFNSGIRLTAGIDYYIGTTLALDSSEGTATATFYIQDLSGSTLQTVSVTQSLTGVYDSTTAFRIGGTQQLGSNVWSGLIDEVRFSDTALSQDQLLISPIPEPRSVALGLGGLAFCVVLFRRSRKTV